MQDNNSNTASCGNCGGTAKLAFRSRDYNRHVTDERFSHYRCQDCGLIFIDPFPHDIGRYYPDDYHFRPRSVGFLQAYAHHEQYKIDIVMEHADGGRLLEIGPSLGSFAYLSKQAGFQTETIEIDAGCSEYLNVEVGIKTINTADTIGALEQLEPYDVIALWHVIEHLEIPWETLDALYDKLAPNGILVIAAPNPAAFQFGVMRRFWPHVDAPRHLLLIPPQIIVSRMQARGMRLELQTTNDPGGLGWNAFGWEYFFRNLVSGDRAKGWLGGFGRFVARLMSPFDQVEGKGAAYTLVLRKGADAEPQQ